jgi:uncharacterized protein YlzI (FlbEa/FlbD family)
LVAESVRAVIDRIVAYRRAVAHPSLEMELHE